MDKKQAPESAPKLHPWGETPNAEKPDAMCSHCSAPFVSYHGMVSNGFCLCPACDSRD
jgi:formylmethanofuran dehydrogenase subunit E